MSRYEKQMLFKSIGEAGQTLISAQHVLIIGAGALGSAAAEILVRSGIGKLILLDRDYVEESNLHRQQLYTEKDAADRIPKAVAAEKRLKSLNSNIEIDSITAEADAELLEELLQKEDIQLMIDATDNFTVRFILNDLACKYKIPWIYGACAGSFGMHYTIIPDKTPCLRCVIGKVPLAGVSCDTAGVIMPAVSSVVSGQTADALKLLSGNQDRIKRGLRFIDVWENSSHWFGVGNLQTKDCPSCGENPSYPSLQYEHQMKTAVLCGRDTVQIRPETNRHIHRDQIEAELSKKFNLESNPFLIAFQAEGKRIVVFNDGRVFIHGSSDIPEAKKLYHRYFG